MMDLGAMFKIKKAWSDFCNRHPKVPPFVGGVSAKGFVVGQEIAIAIRYPDGSEYKTGIRVQEGDLELLNTLKSLSKQ